MLRLLMCVALLSLFATSGLAQADTVFFANSEAVSHVRIRAVSANKIKESHRVMNRAGELVWSYEHSDASSGLALSFHPGGAVAEISFGKPWGSQASGFEIRFDSLARPVYEGVFYEGEMRSEIFTRYRADGSKEEMISCNPPR